MKKMVAKMNDCVVGMYANVKSKVQNEDGVSTIEWVGLAAVVVALMFALAGAMESQGEGLASAIVTKISDIIESINN
ncbi:MULTISPECIES: hypothetical protein [Bacillaceae]|uniref:hypothetical protein n=1 Tax=Bacillaceae TaxID=186817 RepID=UPI00296458D3|nr:hypothetical protein [Bacillus infantis]MDW2879569.1 hypothetical protein [Bacillus infantis]